MFIDTLHKTHDVIIIHLHNIIIGLFIIMHQIIDKVLQVPVFIPVVSLSGDD